MKMKISFINWPIYSSTNPSKKFFFYNSLNSIQLYSTIHVILIWVTAGTPLRRELFLEFNWRLCQIFHLPVCLLHFFRESFVKNNQIVFWISPVLTPQISPENFTEILDEIFTEISILPRIYCSSISNDLFQLYFPWMPSKSHSYCIAYFFKLF